MHMCDTSLIGVFCEKMEILRHTDWVAGLQTGCLVYKLGARLVYKLGAWFIGSLVYTMGAYGAPV